MVQQLFGEVQNMRDEIRRLRGEIHRLAIGGTLLPGAGSGTASVPTAVDGAIIRGNATPAWERLAPTIPGANVRNVVGLDNGDARPSWKTALDSTNPTTAAFGDTPAPGTSLVFSHRDHRHGMPAGITGITIYVSFGSGTESFTP